MLQLECDRSAFVENELLTIGIPMALQNRKDALVKRQRTLSEKQDRYRDMTEQAKRNVDAGRVRLEDTKLRLSRATIPYDIEAIRGEAESLERRIAAYSDQIANWEPLRHEIETEQAAINEESSEIRKALTDP